MYCAKCGGETREVKDIYEGRSFIVMFWCDECDEEVTYKENIMELMRQKEKKK